jgi:hypothetical protein
MSSETVTIKALDGTVFFVKLAAVADQLAICSRRADLPLHLTLRIVKFTHTNARANFECYYLRRKKATIGDGRAPRLDSNTPYTIPGLTNHS